MTEVHKIEVNTTETKMNGIKQCCSWNKETNKRCTNQVYKSSKHCTDHYQYALELYLKYKKLCNMANKLDIYKPGESRRKKIAHLRQCHKLLVKAYNARLIHRNYAFAPECYDFGHNLQFQIIQEKIDKCKNELINLGKDIDKLSGVSDDCNKDIVNDDRDNDDRDNDDRDDDDQVSKSTIETVDDKKISCIDDRKISCVVGYDEDDIDEEEEDEEEIENDDEEDDEEDDDEEEDDEEEIENDNIDDNTSSDEDESESTEHQSTKNSYDKAIKYMKKFSDQQISDKQETEKLISIYIHRNKIEISAKAKIVTSIIKIFKILSRTDCFDLNRGIYAIIYKLYTFKYFETNYKPRKCNCDGFLTICLRLFRGMDAHFSKLEDLFNGMGYWQTAYVYNLILKNLKKIKPITDELVTLFKLYGKSVIIMDLELNWCSDMRRLFLTRGDDGACKRRKSREMSMNRLKKDVYIQHINKIRECEDKRQHKCTDVA